MTYIKLVTPPPTYLTHQSNSPTEYIMCNGSRYVLIDSDLGLAYDPLDITHSDEYPDMMLDEYSDIRPDEDELECPFIHDDMDAFRDSAPEDVEYD